MEKVEQVDVRVKNYFKLAGYEKWATVCATVDRGMVMTSNIAECISACLFEARKLPIYDFLDEVRQMFESWNLKNICLLHILSPHFVVDHKRCLLLMKKRHYVVPSNNYVFSVHHEGRTYIVCLENKTCTCKSFQIDELPCSHAWAFLKKKHFDVGPYCSDLYKPSNLLDTYSIPILPLPDKNEWNVHGYIKDQIVQPPNHKKLPGRPSKMYRDKTYSELYGMKRKNS
ncbi:uncharacterized protein LOC107003743 [Solanum pennellii]|uniref:Uncharacterized protein LOC107003743 n=1 Tax=Solanum pennellii TaxID=28526 RepID=A0ABM1FIY0_SOLPN|nr:uncharacterized protein LOC107003743 [Solanum pennellii]